MIRTPDQRLRVFVSSTMKELQDERRVVREQLERLHLSPVMFELGARPHPPRELYRAYIEQSHVFLGIYWQSYGWVAPGAEVSGLEEEYQLCGDLPRLIYIKHPAPDREPLLEGLLARIQADDKASYKRYADNEELAALVAADLAVLLAERFEAASPTQEASAPSAHSPPPSPLTPTVGRERETTAGVELLRDGSRLVTLTGPGGVGKTRLALEIAAAADTEYPGGAEYVPLASIESPALVAHAIADRLGATPEGAAGALDSIVDVVRGRRVLLVLDNLEQVAEAGPDIVSLLERSLGLQVLATSRQPLRVRGERELAVSPLEDRPAMELFVDRARSANAAFRADEDEAAVAELCRRLDGLPLAIELAAARARLLGPRALLDRLGERLDSLGTAAADLPERQRTLRATIDWSYELLDERERELFARLGIFVGGASVEAAETICADEHGGGVVEGLASLLDKSLIAVPDDPAEGEPRLQMLETVRLYALERLEERGDPEAIRARHLAWYRDLAGRAQPSLCGPGQREWAARLDPERANLRAAAQHALATGDDEAVIELVWDVIVFYFVRDAVHEPESWMQSVADAGRPLNDLMEAKLRSLLALMRIYGGEYSGASDALSSALAVFRSAGMDFEAAVTLKELAWVRYLVDEDADAAVASLQEAARLFARVEHDWGVALTEIQLGSVLTAGRELPTAQQRFTIALERSRRIDNAPLIGQALQNLAVVRILEGRPKDALVPLQEAIAHLRAGRHQTEASYCLDALAAVALSSGEADAAARGLAAAEAVRERLGVKPWPTVEGFVSGLTRRATEQVGAARMEAIFATVEDADVFDAVDEALELVRA